MLIATIMKPPEWVQLPDRCSSDCIVWLPKSSGALKTRSGSAYRLVVFLGLGHHFYYSSLSGKEAGTNNRQQWAHNFGNAFAVLAVAALYQANSLAYKQYFWTIVRGKSFKLDSLDKLFSLTTDPKSFFGLEVLRHAPVDVALALLCW